MLAWPVSRAMLVAVLRSAAMSWGPAPTRIREASSRWVTSRTWWTLFSMAQCPCNQSARSRQSAPRWSREVTAYTVSTEGFRAPTRRPADDLDRPAGAWEQRLSVGAVQVDDLDRA